MGVSTHETASHLPKPHFRCKTPLRTVLPKAARRRGTKIILHATLDPDQGEFARDLDDLCDDLMLQVRVDQDAAAGKFHFTI